MSGRLVVIEGLDGSGKATQTALLCEALTQIGVRLKRVSFPDYQEKSSALVQMYLGGELGAHPQEVNAFAASSFYAVDRFASYVRHWRSDYASGSLIVADRYTTSNMVYQMTKLPRSEWDSYLDWVRDFEYNKLGLPAPNCSGNGTGATKRRRICTSRTPPFWPPAGKAHYTAPKSWDGLSFHAPGTDGSNRHSKSMRKSWKVKS